MHAPRLPRSWCVRLGLTLKGLACQETEDDITDLSAKAGGP
ncbi:hypothetical protein PCL1606_32100 [Pseudomonas chlororaphis]|uniref:Uncharacterized protein n=1 Tax=Pseudomonas chlororaphis TaxID=587753 RepID=A0A0D5Y0U6_9PSED|nr:hypothetical protein PCL1606_32100 [Pseudomonas chlororaphis]